MATIRWLASFQKSGNTWVRAFLEAYSRGHVNINHMTEVAGDSRLFYHQLISSVPVDQLLIYSTMCVRLNALNNMLLSEARGERLILKTHFARVMVGDLPTIPEGLTGPSVYIIRDPRDVAVSLAAFQNKPIDDVINQMKNGTMAISSKKRTSVTNFTSSWDTNVRSWETYDKAIVIRYEDLKADPETYFEAILEQYEYDYSQEKCRAAIEATELSRLQDQERKDGFKESPGDHQFFGGERPKLSKEQEQQIIEAFAPTMEKYGYIASASKVA